MRHWCMVHWTFHNLCIYYSLNNLKICHVYGYLKYSKSCFFFNFQSGYKGLVQEFAILFRRVGDLKRNKNFNKHGYGNASLTASDVYGRGRDVLNCFHSLAEITNFVFADVPGRKQEICHVPA